MRIAIVCICILFPSSPIFPIWNGLLREIRIPMSVCVYYSFDHLTAMRIAMYMCILIPVITYFPNMEGVAHRKENCNVCMCILFLCAPISLTWRDFSEKWELQCLYLYIIPLITDFRNMEVVAHINENLQGMYVNIIPWSPLSSSISQKMEGVAHIKWELQYLYVYIVPLITYFRHGGVAERN